MSRAEPALPLRHALALGLLQGPTELLPVSSSGHTTLLPWLAGWRYAELDGRRRKSFELALHAGAGLALAVDMRAEIAAAIGGGADRRAGGALVLSIMPPAVAGLALRGAIERSLGGPRSIALGLLAGAVAMAAADLRPAHGGARGCAELTPRDGLALGLAQATALMPGVSRSGATLTAARARGFDRPSAQALSWGSALPVILGAALLELVRAVRGRGGQDGGHGAATLLGGVAAFASTLLSARLLRRAGGRALAPYALYRAGLAGLVLRVLRGRRAAAAQQFPPAGSRPADALAAAAGAGLR